jgi:hypothetical protein
MWLAYGFSTDQSEHRHATHDYVNERVHEPFAICGNEKCGIGRASMRCETLSFSVDAIRHVFWSANAFKERLACRRRYVPYLLRAK